MPLARGNYTTPTDRGWVYFRTGGKGIHYFCGIGPNASVAGCDLDFVPDHPPAGTNEIILDSSGMHCHRSGLGRLLPRRARIHQLRHVPLS
jgi:hypothetical protein